MMEFIIMTLSFTVAHLLAALLICVLAFSKPVVKFYAKHVVKWTTDFEKILESEFEEKEL